jgi:hypothetical protein
MQSKVKMHIHIGRASVEESVNVNTMITTCTLVVCDFLEVF